MNVADFIKASAIFGGGGGAPVTISGGLGVDDIAIAVVAPGWSFAGGQWYNDVATAIAGATTLSYARKSADVGKALSFVPTGLPYRAEAGITAIFAPGAPTGVTLTAGIGTVSASWVAPISNGGSAITSYRGILYDADGQVVKLMEGAPNPALFTGLPSDGPGYLFAVLAINSAGLGSLSALSNLAIPLPAPVGSSFQSSVVGGYAVGSFAV